MAEKDQTHSETCTCCSGKCAQDCCAPLLNRQSIAKTPVQLMRSRYSAYALGGYGDYLLETWSTKTRQGLSSTELSARSIKWLRLEILGKAQTGDKGQVEFNAFYLNKEGKEQVHHERSSFERVNGCWYYVVGTML